MPTAGIFAIPDVSKRGSLYAPIDESGNVTCKSHESGLEPDWRKIGGRRWISRGVQVCTQLRNGMTPQQIIDANPIVCFDLRGVIDAAQHELCPDTLH